MGRPGPMGQLGGKGEKVRGLTTQAVFYIMFVAGLRLWVLYTVYSG